MRRGESKLFFPALFPTEYCSFRFEIDVEAKNVHFEARISSQQHYVWVIAVVSRCLLIRDSCNVMFDYTTRFGGRRASHSFRSTHTHEKQELIFFRNRLTGNLAAIPSFVGPHLANVWHYVQVPAT